MKPAQYDRYSDQIRFEYIWMEKTLKYQLVPVEEEQEEE
jgi:predicted metal-dependent HD superfamily phosphohydrolase